MITIDDKVVRIHKLAQKLPWLRDVARVVSITDPAKDPDDENTMIMMGYCTLQGAVHMLATVANLAPTKERALLTRSTLDLLGMDNVPVGMGTACGQSFGFQPEDYQWRAPYVDFNAVDKTIPDGQQLLENQFVDAANNSITLLLISGMTDAAHFVMAHPRLFQDKVREVVIMSGVVRSEGRVVLSDEGYMLPDTAANNAFDAEAAQFLYLFLQTFDIPMWILTREAAYGAPFPRH